MAHINSSLIEPNLIFNILLGRMGCNYNLSDTQVYLFSGPVHIAHTPCVRSE